MNERNGTMSIVVYSAGPHCHKCRATMRMLDQLEIPYEVIDVSEDPHARDFVTSLGFREAPVVDTGAEMFEGHRPSKLEALVGA